MTSSSPLPAIVLGLACAGTAAAQDVLINGRTLSESQLRDMTALYGVRPRPGNYWYDARSGLYGAVGFPAYGTMYPGHDFGQLSRQASSGDTGVLINGREIALAEYAVWSNLLGTPIAPGSYWLDALGNVGYEGNPFPAANLYVVAQSRMAPGGGAGGDNFWSSRFSAGNHDGNGRGYVSVPGYGPVGYGFD